MWQVKRPALMAYPEDLILRHTLRRLAEVFGVPGSSLLREARFGQELKPASASLTGGGSRDDGIAAWSGLLRRLPVVLIRMLG
jgi:hypothetical protein